MKKNLIALVIVSVATLAGTSRANAQMVSNSNSLEHQKNIIETKDLLSEPKAISPRALKNFAKTHKNVMEEQWTKSKDGFFVTYVSDGIRTTVFYDKKGNWVGDIKYYSEEKMPREVRHIVKRAYYDYNIVGTQEVETIDSRGVPTYIVTVEDKANIKLIRTNAGEMEVWKQFTKTN